MAAASRLFSGNRLPLSFNPYRRANSKFKRFQLLTRLACQLLLLLHHIANEDCAMSSGISLNSALGYTPTLTKKTSTSASDATSTDLLQKAANASVSGSTSAAAVNKPQNAAEQFLQYMNMSDEDKLKYSLLNQMGISKDDYDAMPADKKADVDKKIADRMTQIDQAQNQSGGAAQGVAGKLQSFINSAQASVAKIPLINLMV